MTYWISTGLLSMLLALSAWSYLFHQATIVGIQELGFPSFFRIQLAILKLAAAALILLPAVPSLAKDWAYAGVALFILTALVAHIAHRDSFWITLANFAFATLLAVSYYCFRQGLDLS